MIYFLLCCNGILLIAAMWQARCVYIKFQQIETFYDKQIQPPADFKKRFKEAHSEASFFYTIVFYNIIVSVLIFFFYRHEIKSLICQ